MTLHVSNIPETLSEQEFRNLLKSHKIFYLRVDKPLGRSFAFIRLSSPAQVEPTIKRLHNLRMDFEGYSGRLIACMAHQERLLLPKERFEQSKADRRAVRANPTSKPTSAAPSISTSNPDDSSALVDSAPATPAVPTNLPSSPANQLPSASQLSSANVPTQQDTPRPGSDEPLSPSTSSSTPPTTQLSSSPTSITPPENSNTPPRLTSKHPRDTPGDSPDLHNSPKRHPSLDHETLPTQLALTEPEDD
jgi:hypothetical protein